MALVGVHPHGARSVRHALLIRGGGVGGGGAIKKGKHEGIDDRVMLGAVRAYRPVKVFFFSCQPMSEGRGLNTQRALKM